MKFNLQLNVVYFAENQIQEHLQKCSQLGNGLHQDDKIVSIIIDTEHQGYHQQDHVDHHERPAKIT